MQVCPPLSSHKPLVGGQGSRTRLLPLPKAATCMGRSWGVPPSCLLWPPHPLSPTKQGHPLSPTCRHCHFTEEETESQVSPSNSGRWGLNQSKQAPEDPSFLCCCSLPTPAAGQGTSSREPLGVRVGGTKRRAVSPRRSPGGRPEGRVGSSWDMTSRTSLVLRGPRWRRYPHPVHRLQPSVHLSSHLAVPPTIAGAHSSALPNCTLTSQTPAQSGGDLVFLAVGG